MLRWVAALVMVVVLRTPVNAAPSKSVLILHEGSELLPYQIIASQELKKTFSASTDLHIEVFEEYLDTWRLRANLSELAAALDHKYSTRKIDVIVADGAIAFHFLKDYPPEVFRAVPVVFHSITDLSLPPSLPSQMTGVMTHVDYARTVQLAMTLQPGLEHLYYIVGTHDYEAPSETVLRQKLQSIDGKLNLVVWNDRGLADLLKDIHTLPPHSAVLYESYYGDPEGNTYVPADICTLLSAAANAPVYVLFKTMIGKGAIGGVVVDFVPLSHRAAEIAVALLRGRKPSELSVEQSRNQVAIDWRQLGRFQIPYNRVPQSATVLFREPTIWQKYGIYLALSGFVVLLQLVLIIMLSIEVNRRKRSEASTRALAGRLIHAQEEERCRIARELHDDFSQRLSLLCMQLDGLRASPPGTQDTLIQRLTQLYDQTDSISSEVHQLSHELHSALLEKLGLAPALYRFCEELSLHRKISVNISTSGERTSLNRDVALALFRVAQECLINVSKHSGASSADLRLDFAREKVLLEIQDSGRGFEKQALAQSPGLGIESMRERLRSVGGTFYIHSRPGHGTIIHAEVPTPTITPETDSDLAASQGGQEAAA